MWNSIFKRDLYSFFCSNSIYFVMIAYILLSMIVTFLGGLYIITPNQNMISFFAFQPQIFAIIIPAITMRSWAEEQRSGTIENLLTFPIATLNMTLSKFGAAFIAGSLLLVFSLPLLVTTTIYLQPDWGSIICSYLGLLGTISILTAAGCLVSSIFSTPAIAYLLGFLSGTLWINFNWGSFFIAKLNNAPFYFERILNFSDIYQIFLNGQINISAIFYFLSLLLLLLFANWLIIDYRRK